MSEFNIGTPERFERDWLVWSEGRTHGDTMMILMGMGHTEEQSEKIISTLFMFGWNARHYDMTDPYIGQVVNGNKPL